MRRTVPSLYITASLAAEGRRLAVILDVDIGAERLDLLQNHDGRDGREAPDQGVDMGDLAASADDGVLGLLDDGIADMVLVPNDDRLGVVHSERAGHQGERRESKAGEAHDADGIFVERRRGWRSEGLETRRGWSESSAGVDKI